MNTSLNHPRTLARPFLALAALLTLATAAVNAAELPGSGTPAARELAAAEDALFAAKVAKDYDAIVRGYADEMLYVHTPGVTQDRAAHIELIKNGRLDYKKIAAKDRIVRVFGDVGITRGKIVQSVRDIVDRTEGYMAVYIKRDGRWQMLDWVTTRVPGQPEGGQNNAAQPNAQPAAQPAAPRQ